MNHDGPGKGHHPKVSLPFWIPEPFLVLTNHSTEHERCANGQVLRRQLPADRSLCLTAKPSGPPTSPVCEAPFGWFRWASTQTSQLAGVNPALVLSRHRAGPHPRVRDMDLPRCHSAPTCHTPTPWILVWTAERTRPFVDVRAPAYQLSDPEQVTLPICTQLMTNTATSVTLCECVYKHA